MGDAQHPWVSHLCNPCFCSSGSPSGPRCWFFCRILLDVTSVSAAGSCLLLVVSLEVLELLQMLGFTLLSLLSALATQKII